MQPGGVVNKGSLIDILKANMPPHGNRIAAVLLTLSLICACGRPPTDSSSNPGDAQKLPFDRQPRSTGISPSQSLIPSSTQLPEGTPISIRLQSALSSASSRTGDTFNATIDEPVVIDGQTLIARGTAATGRVLEAKPAATSSSSSLGSLLEPGYLRIVLVSLNVGGKTVTVETFSIFAKGFHEERNSAGAASGSTQKDKDKDKDIVLGKDRRLTFRLAQTVDLQ